MLSERQLTPEKNLIGKDTIEIFKNEEFGAVRTVEMNGKPYFAASDVARALGYSNPRDAIARHCKGVVKHDGVSITVNQHGTESQQVAEMSFIPEGDIYRLITHSKLPSAEKFELWVFDEVLPSIRKNGLYATDKVIDEILSNPDFGIQLLTNLKEEREKNKFLTGQVEKQQQVIEAQQPKVTYYDMVLQCTSLIKTTDIAKDYGESAQWLKKYLLDKEIIFWQGNRKNGRYYLYADYAPMGYAQSQTYSYQNYKGMYESKTHLYWTQKGRYFIYETLKADGILPIVERVA
jgi:prophage antirepressor-like protein